jgi:hypothetical protein
LLALEQKLHRGKSNSAVTQPIDQMDDDRRGDKRNAPQHKCRIQKVLSDPAHAIPHAATPQPSRSSMPT